MSGGKLFDPSSILVRGRDESSNDLPIKVEDDGNGLGVLGVSSSGGIKRASGTIDVSAGTGSVALTDVNIKADFIGVQSPTSSTTFTVTVVDTDTGMDILSMLARSGDNGNARSKSLGLALFDITITVTNASADDTFDYLIMG